MLSYPEEPPKIHWQYYIEFLGCKHGAFMCEMKKKYEATVIPYPKDVYTKKLEKELNEMKCKVEEFKKESNTRIAEYQRQLEEIKSSTPFEHMSMEEFMISFPKYAPNFIERPTFWPHTPEEQINENPTIAESSTAILVATHAKTKN